jgi:flagellar basal-body rod protein FlgC
MPLSQTFAISAAGMHIERTRVETAALNLANAHTVQAPGQAPYQPLRVVATSAAQAAPAAFADLVDSGLNHATAILAASVPVAVVVPTGTGARVVHEPDHPSADAQGWVRYPGVDTATEMMTLMRSARAYEANVAAMNTSKNLALKTLDIGGANA